VSALAFVLYAVSFALMGGCAALVAAWGIRRFVAWRSESGWPGPVTYIDSPSLGERLQPPYVGPHPIYSRMVAENPEVIPILARARRRIVRLDIDTSKFEEGMRRLATALHDVKISDAQRRALGRKIGDQLYGKATRRRGE
jgi:hypothetical protein